MSRTIKKQFEYAVHECLAFGESKRANKFNKEIDTSWKIYSFALKRDMLALAKDFGDFLKENHPKLKMSYEISSKEIQDYMDYKSLTCVDKTLKTKMSHLGKLEKCCKHTFSNSRIQWNMGTVNQPVSTKNARFEKNKPVPIGVSQEAIIELDKNRSEVVNAVRLSAYAGMRIEEATCLKVENIYFSGGECGFGWVNIIKGPDGGSKGGRGRIIPIINEEAQLQLKKSTEGKQPEQYVVSKSDGGKMTVNNALKRLGAWMDSKYGDLFLGNRFHGMRKNWAQMYYDYARSKGCNVSESIGKTNDVLGHGYNRGRKFLQDYVKIIW